MTDIVLELFRAVIIGVILVYLWQIGQKENIHHQPGWRYILGGFSLLFFGMLVDISDNFPSLNRYVLIGDTEYEAFLEKVVGYLFGFILLAVGFWKWMPTIIALRTTQRQLQEYQDKLENKVDERTVELTTITEQLAEEIDERRETEEALRESDSRFRQIAENIEAVLWMMTPDLAVMIYISPVYERIWGRTCQSIYDDPQSWMDAVHSEDKERVVAAYQNMARVGVYEEEYRIVKPDGSVCWVRDHGFPIRDDGGHIYRIAGFVEEITRHKEAEVLVQEKTAYLDSVLTSSVNLAIAATDLDFRIAYYNPTAEDIFGYTAREVIGRTVMDMHTKENVAPARLTRAIEIVKEKGEYNYAVTTEKNGETRFIDSRVSGIWNQDRELIGFVLMSQDVTEHKKDKAEQARLQRELQQAQKMEALGQLSGGIAHDFNNMLGIIMGYSGLAKDQCIRKGESRLAEQLEHILVASERARNLVLQMLTYSRKEIRDDKPLQLQSMLKEDLAMLRSTLPSSIEIHTEIEEDLPFVLMEQTQLSQLLMNLCINARDAMEGKGSITIHLGWVRGVEAECATCHKWIEGDWVGISITDTGGGIRPEVLGRIFDPFFTTKAVNKGTGMGMAVVHGIVRSHGGHILVQTEAGKGTTFRLLLPPVVEEITEAPGTDQSSSDLPLGQGRQVMVVDDEPDLAGYLGDLLEIHGYRATVLTDSEEALERLTQKNHEFALLITDQTMPKITGVELVKTLREVHSDIPVILNTGFSDDVDAEFAAKMGILYLEKPISTKRLILAIEELLKPTEQR